MIDDLVIDIIIDPSSWDLLRTMQNYTQCLKKCITKLLLNGYVRYRQYSAELGR